MRPILENRVPDEVRTPHPRHRLDRWPERLAGRAVRAVDTHGKHLFLRFEGGLTLHSHLRMTGTWAVYSEGQRWERASRRAWLALRTGDHQVVQFDGPVLALMTDARARSDRRLATLGPDILAPGFNPATALARLRADDPTRPIGDALLDQRVLAGIGNAWKVEACFAQGLDPWRLAGEVPDGTILDLLAWTREGMRRSSELGADRRPRLIYATAGRPCPRCATRIRQRPQSDDGRLTYWCPGCQH